MSSEATAKKNIQKLQRVIVDGLEDVKGQDIQVFNTEGLSPLFERVIVASGTSNRQTKALAASVRDAVREAGFDKPRMEGEDNGEWIIVDCGPAVVHVMQPSIRQYYRLEEIWGEKPVRMKHGEAKPRMARAEAAEPVAAKPVSGQRTAAKRAASSARSAPATGRPTTTKTGGKAGAKTSSKTGAKAGTKTARPAAKKAVPVVKVGAAPKKAAAKKAPATKAATSQPVAQKPAAKSAAKPAVKSSAAKAASRKAPASQPTTARKAPAAKKAAAKTVARKATPAKRPRAA